MPKNKKYRNVYIKIIITYIIINFLLLGCIQISNSYVQQELQSEYINSMMTSLKFHGKSLESKLLYAKNIQEILIDNYRIKWLIYQAPIESTYNIYAMTREVQDLLSIFEGTNSLIEDIGVYMRPFNQIISYEKGVIRDVAEFDISGIIGDSLITSYKDEFYLLNRPLSVGGIYHSLCYVKINKRELQQILEDIQNMVEGGQVGFFHDSKPLCITKGFEGEFIENLLDKDLLLPEAGEVKTHKGKYFLFNTNIVSSNLQIIMYFDGDNIFEPVEKSNKVFKICMVISTIALGIFIIYTHYVVNKPLKQLMQVMKNIEDNNNNMDMGIVYHTQDQFQYIFEGFTHMIECLKNYIEKNYEQELELKRSELKQLQTQINPHFLYNCFFNISKMCKIDDSESAMILSQKLARYYMFITRNGEDYVRLEEEYEHTKVYLDIQSIRFGPRVAIQMKDFPEQLREVRVPRIILQPLVENCYKYVFEKLSKSGEINIDIWHQQDQWIIISVEDNGNLITDSEIGELNRKFMEHYKKQEITGLLNVNRRLRLSFGQASGLSASRGALGGLKIEVKIMLGG